MELKDFRLPNGQFAEYTWPGGYPIIYFFKDWGICCPDCVNGENGSLAHPDAEDPQWRIVQADIFYEGASVNCSHCGTIVESAYGDPDAPKQEKIA